MSKLISYHYYIKIFSILDHGAQIFATHMDSLVLLLASNAPMNILEMEMMTQASEMGAKYCTNLTPTAQMSVSRMTSTVPYTRKLFQGSWWMSPKKANLGAMYVCANKKIQ